MSRPITITDTVTSHPVSYDSGYQAASVSNLANAYNNSSNTSYATINLTTGSNATTQIFYNFGDLGIPSGATINSVSCSCKCYISTTNTSRISTKEARLYSGSTAKGTAYTSITNNTTAFNITAGSWTASELNNAKIRLYVVRGTSNTTTTHYLRFYGATLSVNYTYNGIVYSILASSTYSGATVSPTTQEVNGGESGTVAVYVNDLNNIKVEDNGTDVTENLQYVIPQVNTQTFTGVPTSYDSTSSSYYDTYNNTNDNAVDGVYSNNVPENGLRAQNTSTRACVFSNTGSNAESKLVYNFNCSSIPANATITSVTCVAGASCYSSGQYFETKTVQLYSGNTAKGTAVNITGSGGTAANHTIDGGSWTRSELDNAKIVERVVRGTSNTTTASSFSFWGATLTVKYTVPQTPYYAYTLTNVSADHTVVVSENIIIPPEEDPTKTYYSLTISNINATTDPGRGTTRVEGGTSEVIEIYPSDPQITLVTDNGADITNQLVAHGGGEPTYTVTTASGADYGFNLNTSTGYYTSTNAGSSKTAAVCVVNFNLPVRCLVTIQYINYAEATYDFGVFGNIDTTLSNNYYAAGSGGATITDTSYRLACNTSAYNKSSAQTLTYEIPSGEHYIYIKYSKDDATDSNNDTLQFKISNIEELESNVSYYTYSLPNISQNHSLVFVFGNVSYYFVNSSVTGDARIYPDGQMVQLAGDNYSLVTVPLSGNTGGSVTVIDNGVDVSNSVIEKIETVEKDGETITVVNYVYNISNIQATHNVSVSYVASAGGGIYVKSGGAWVQKVSVYRKVSGVWVQQTINANLFDYGVIYIKEV